MGPISAEDWSDADRGDGLRDCFQIAGDRLVHLPHLAFPDPDRILMHN